MLFACRKECVAKDVVKKGCSESSFAISRCRQDLLQEAREEAREEVREEAREEVMEPEVGAWHCIAGHLSYLFFAQS